MVYINVLIWIILSFLINKESFMGSSYILVVLGIILAKGIGFFRNIAFSGIFEQSVEADIYFQVFNIVNLIFAGIGVALSTLVIKNMNKAENQGNEKAYVSAFLRKSFLLMTAVAACIALLAKPLIKFLLLPDLAPEHLGLAVKLMHIMCPSLVFIVIAYIISGVLQNEKVFFITSIMSLPFNAVIISALYIPGVSIVTIGIVTTIGWFLHIAILLPSFYKKGYRLAKANTNKFKAKDKNSELIWIFISNMMFQLCFYIDRAFLSGTEGTIATLSYASDLFVIIASIFVVAMSTVFFPSISKNYEEGNIDYINKTLRYMITVMTAIFIPFLLVMGLFGYNIIDLIYDFTPEATGAVSTLLFICCLGIFGYITQELFNKILYTAGRYSYCVAGTIGVIVLNLISNSVIKRFVPDTAFFGTGVTTRTFFIALSSSVLMLFYAILISFAIKKIVGSYWKRDLITDILKIVLCSLAAFGTYLIFSFFTPWLVSGTTTFIIPVLACGCVYIAALYITGVLKVLLKKKGNV